MRVGYNSTVSDDTVFTGDAPYPAPSDIILFGAFPIRVKEIELSRLGFCSS